LYLSELVLSENERISDYSAAKAKVCQLRDYKFIPSDISLRTDRDRGSEIIQVQTISALTNIFANSLCHKKYNPGHKKLLNPIPIVNLRLN
jgi:hypothetical protein